MTEESKKYIGLIGLGYWGKNILRNIYELGSLHTACDFNDEIIEERKKTYPHVTFTASIDDIMNNPDIKAVAIASPAASHYHIVKKALRAQKDVFVEKPLALTVREGEELVEYAKKENRVLMVGHILHYHSAVVKLKKMIHDGELGKIYYIYSNRLNIGKLRTEENILWSFAPHDISVIMMLLEEEPVKVKGFGGYYLNIRNYDTTMTTLEFRNGVKGHIFVSWLHPFKEQKLIVVGSKAMAVFDDMSDEKLFLYPHKIQWQEGKIPVAQKADYTVIPVGKAEPLKEELRHFMHCVKTRERPKTDGAEGLQVLRVLNMAENTLKDSIETEVNHEKPSYFVHSTSSIDSNVTIGQGTSIWHYSHVLKNSRIGNNCIVGQNTAIGPDVVVGSRCKIQNNVSIYRGVTLEDEVFCAPSCVFTNVYNPRAFIERKHEFRTTLVKKGATVGANATIICGVTIGRYAMIGAGALVKTDVPDYAIFAGVPARQKGWTCRCGTTLAFSHNMAHCSYCGNQYRCEEGGIIPVNGNG